MQTLITIGSKVLGNPPTSYTMAELRRIAKAAVGKQGKLVGLVVNFDEAHGNTRLFASYESAPNQQTYTTVAL